MQSQCIQVDSCHSSDCESPPPDGAFQVSSCRQSDGLQMEAAVCVLPQGHSTRPLLRHCFSASLETSLSLFLHHLTSQAVETDGSHGNSDSYSAFTCMERASVEGLYVSVSRIIISGDNRLDQDEAILTSMEFFIRESCICVSNEHSCT